MNVQHLVEKWSPVLDHPDLGAIKDSHKRAVVAQLLENQETDCRSGESAGYRNPTSLLSETAPINSMGASSSVAGDGNIDIYDPVLISLVRRSMPNLIAYDICGVQPMTGPTGLIFAMRSRYSTQGGTEALFNEANTGFAQYPGVSATGSTPVNDPANDYIIGTGMTTANAEALGDGTAVFQEMAFSIEKVSVVARSRALKAEYTMELAQDLKAVHGLDAEQELANILSAEILAEINREVVRQINLTASLGAQENVASAGTFNLDVDANGRWSVEKFKGLMFQLERESNAIAKATRRGKGNIMICSSDVASALQMAGVLDYTPALANNLQVDDTGNTFAGVLNGRIRVYVDPYFAATSGVHYATIGYKGSSAFDAGLFYCPYVPLQMVRAVGQDTFQPKIAFKTRYGMVANPFATSAADGTLAFANKNIYYRKIAISNLM
jgi:hypothetical protein